jgi:D-alanyl-D-alanine carboxypeptidase
MTSARTTLAVAAALVALVGVPAPSVTAEPTIDLAAALDAAIDERIKQMGVPGAVVALSMPGEIDYVKAFGVGDTATGMPMLVDDHMRIGSVTKTFTGTAVLQLVD